MILEWFVFMGLYWYLENVMVVGHGTSKSCCFCLNTNYWKCLGGSGTKHNQVADETDRQILDTIPTKVLEEHEIWHGGILSRK